MLVNVQSIHLFRHLACAAALAMAVAAGCSAHTESGGMRGEAGSDESPSGSSGPSAGAGGTAISPGAVGGAGVSDEGAAGAPGREPLKGAAFFDFDCSPDATLPEGDACAVCEQTLCKDELAGALGDGWTMGQAEGPCMKWFECLQNCECNDQTCYKACSSHLGEGTCPAAFAPFDACLSSTCMSSCSSSSTG